MKFKLALLCLAVLAMSAQAATVITPDDSNIQYRGRWDFSSPSAPWCHAKSCTIIVNFQGTSIASNFSGGSGDYIRVIIDDDALGSVKIATPTGLTTLASGLSDTNHKIEIVKETDIARITFNGFEIDDGKSLNSPPARPPRKFEFYGDSNQAGNSSESERNSGDTDLRGNYYTYPAYISRMFDAEYINFSKSGSQIENTNTSHDRIDWGSSTPLWDFNNFQADLVVVNVGANDKGPDGRKRDKYHAFLDNLRAEHPNAHIMLYNSFGWATNEPANYIHEVIAERGDSNMSSAVFPWVFAQWHGCQYEHAGMAMYLADHLQTTLGWTPSAPLDVFSGFGWDGDVANGSFEEVAPFGGWGWRYFDNPGVSRVYDPAGAQDGSYYLSLSNGATSQQTNPASDGDLITVTVWMRGANTGDQADITIDFRHQGQGGREQSAMISFSETKTLTTSWAQYSFAATAPTDMNPVYGNRVTFTAGSGDTVYIDDAARSIGSGPDPVCGDETCDPGEDQCNCPDDCGTPPATETNCTDGIDEDCDGEADCNDPTGDCDSDPACQSACDGDGVCEPGEDCNNCSSDCDSKTNGPPSGRYCCGDGEQTGPEGDGRCDGNY